jgi:pyrroloquinoline-quinone synthase
MGSESFVARLRQHGRRAHPFDDAMLAGKLSQRHLQTWIANRHFCETRISKTAGGWLRLARTVGLNSGELLEERHVLPGVRFACAAYLSLMRDATPVETAAASLAELFAPESALSWRAHYPYLDDAANFLNASDDALAFVVTEARSGEAQARCLAALVRKSQVHHHLLDCVCQTLPL